MKEAAGFAEKMRQNIVFKYDFLKEHAGTGNVARARGLKEAENDWVLFIDSGTACTRPLFQLLYYTIRDESNAEWIVWDAINYVDPVPMLAPASIAKLVDKSKGMPYCIGGVQATLKRELAQSVEWPNVKESDWAYYSQIWNVLLAREGSVDAAEARMSFIPTVLTLSYAARNERRVKPPLDKDTFLALKEDEGWTEDISWLKRFGTQPT